MLGPGLTLSAIACAFRKPSQDTRTSSNKSIPCARLLVCMLDRLESSWAMVRRPVVSRGLEAEFRAFADGKVRLGLNSLSRCWGTLIQLEEQFVPPTLLLTRSAQETCWKACKGTDTCCCKDRCLRKKLLKRSSQCATFETFSPMTRHAAR
jgi:hypothetical protein